MIHLHSHGGHLVEHGWSLHALRCPNLTLTFGATPEVVAGIP